MAKAHAVLKMAIGFTPPYSTTMGTNSRHTRRMPPHLPHPLTRRRMREYPRMIEARK